MTSTFLLLIDESAASAAPQRPIEVPQGLSFLNGSDGQPPRLGPERAADGVLAAFENLEAEGGRRAALLMFAVGNSAPRRNGQPAPIVSALEIRDQLSFGSDLLLHLSARHDPYLGRPLPAQLDRECPVCRVPFVAESRVYVCPVCDTASHCEGDEKPASDRLECALLGPCAVCGEPVQSEGGLQYDPHAEEQP